MGATEDLRAAAQRAAEQAQRLGALDSEEGRSAVRSAADLVVQLARHLLEAGDTVQARAEAEHALSLLDPLQGFASALPGIPALRLDAHQILGTVLLEEGEQEAAVEQLRRAASFVYESQPDERPIAVACPPLELQLRDLWRELVPSPLASRIHASLRAVRTMRGHLDDLVAAETRSLRGASSAYEAGVDHPFYAAAARLVERPLLPGDDTLSVLERSRARVEQLAAASGSDAASEEEWAEAHIELVEALQRAGHRSEAVAVVEQVIDRIERLGTDARIMLSHRATHVVLHALRSDLGVRLTRGALDALLEHPTEDASRGAELEGVARFAYGRALSEHDDDVSALQESEHASRILSTLVAAGCGTPVLVAATYAAAHLAFLRENAGDGPGAADAIEDALQLARALADDRPDEVGVLGAVLETAMSNARRRTAERGQTHFRAAVDLLEVAYARDPADNAVGLELFNASGFLIITSEQRDSPEVRSSLERSRELLARMEEADPGGLPVVFHQAQKAEEEAFLALIAGKETAFRWKAQDCVKLHDRQIAMAPHATGALSRKAVTCLHFARSAARMHDRKLARRMIDQSLPAARRQVELQPDVVTVREALVTRLNEARQVAGSIGDVKLQRRLAGESLEATRSLARLAPDDVDAQYGLMDALTSAVAVIGEGRMRDVEHLFDEASALLADLGELDPLHPRLRRFTYEMLETEALRAAESDDDVAVVRSAVRALQVPYGGMVIRHHHGNDRPVPSPHERRVDVLAYTLRRHLQSAAGVLDAAEIEEASAVLVRLRRSGIGPGMDDLPDPEERARARPEPEDDIPEVLAPAIDPGVSRSVAETLRTPPHRFGARTYIKPINGGHPKLHFGVGLAASEDLIAVGAPGDPSAEHHVMVDGDAEDRSAHRRGAVHIYRRSTEGWEHEAYLKPDIPVDGLEFGWSVAIDGTTVVVGAPSATFPREDEEDLLPGERRPPLGGIWTFVRDEGVWRPDDLLLPDPDLATLKLGSRLALQGDTLLASGIDWETGHGVVHEFVREGREWTWRSVIRSPRAAGTTEESMGFGFSLALDGETAVIGEPRYPGPIRAVSADPVDDLICGAAWVFRRDARGRWEPEAMLLGPTPRLASMHGGSVALRDSLIAVTAGLHPVSLVEQPSGPSRAGAVTLYGRSATGWEGLATLAAPDPHSQEFGSSIAVDEQGEVLIGSALDAHGKDWSAPPDIAGGPGPRYGAVHVLAATPDGWRFTAGIVAAEPSEAAEFGSRIAVSGRDLIVAAPNDSSSGRGIGAELHDADASESGAVHVVTR